MSARCDGCIRTEEYALHREVVWEFDYPQSDARSPIFVDGHRKYVLCLSESYVDAFKHFSIHLCRLEPAFRSPDGCVQWWAGLKRPDGAYYHRIESGYLREPQPIFQMAVNLNMFGEEEVKAQRLVSDGRLTFFLRLSARQDYPAAEEYVLGRPWGPKVGRWRFLQDPAGSNPTAGMDDCPMLAGCLNSVTDVYAWGDGSVLEKSCPLHTEVQWNVLHESSSTYWCFVSPEFVVGNQRYRLELISVSYERMDLNLYRLGPSEEKTGTSASVKWWAGLRRHEGSRNHMNASGQLDLSADCRLMKKVAPLKHFAGNEVQWLCRNLSVFFLLSRGRTSTAADVCTHGAAYLLTRNDGVIEEEECRSHKEVEWNVCLSTGLTEFRRNLASPVFVIGNQQYLLKLSSIGDLCLSLNLFRRGPAVGGPAGFVHWWAGLKKVNGIYYDRIESKKLTLGYDCDLWSEVECLKTVTKSELDMEQLVLDGCVTFFLRMSGEKSAVASDACNHDFPEMFGRSEDSIREKDNTSYKEVEWDFCYKPSPDDWRLTSPHFVHKNRGYMLELCCSHGFLELHLHSRTFLACTRESFKYSAGLKCVDGTYNHRMEGWIANPLKALEMWQKEARSRRISQGELERMHLAPNGLVTFYIRTEKQPETTWRWTARTLGTRMMSRQRSGSVAEEAGPSYKLVEWLIDRGPTRGEILTSPEFSIDNQRFVLDLSSASVHLFRMGPSDDRPARWILAARDCVGPYDQSGCGKLDLEGACEIWTNVENVCLRGKFEADEGKHLTISFLLIQERGPTTPIVGSDDVEALQNSQSMGQEDVVFNVQGKEFKVRRAVIRIRVPVLDAMFKHDTLERRTGVVQIDDCDPAVFEIFVKYVVTGELPDVPTDEDFALYALADKYLMAQLRLWCLRRIRYALTVDSFCDVVELIFRYGGDDLLIIANQFLARNKDIFQSGVWENFKREYPQAACNLETHKSFPTWLFNKED